MRRLIIAAVVLATAGLGLAGCGGSQGTPSVTAPATVTETNKVTVTDRATVTKTAVRTATATATVTAKAAPATTDAPPADTPSTFATPITVTGSSATLPEGFRLKGLFYGVATPKSIKYTPEENDTCGTQSCFHLDVWDNFGCPNGVKVAVGVYDGPSDDKNAPKVRTDSVVTDPIGKNNIGRTLVVVDRTGTTAPRLSFSVVDVNCAFL